MVKNNPTNGTYPTVRNVIVESYNGLPGYFQINGDLNYFRGLSFNLENNNTLGIQHVDGIRPESEGNIGPIQTNARIYGTSRYIFNSAIGNQQTGTGLPNYVKTIISDNSSTTANRKVFLSNYVELLQSILLILYLLDKAHSVVVIEI